MLQAYPSLTETEFLEACGALERRCHDRLSGSDWLSVKYTGRELQIIQSRSKPKKSHSDKFSARAEGTKGGELDAENEIDDGEKDEQDDEASLRRQPPRDLMQVSFSITLSATYAVPVLWFSSKHLNKVEEVHRLMVASHVKESVREVGIVGGISRAYHPVSDFPSFFIHPCNTHEALLAVGDGTGIHPEQYLLLWLGVLGSAVGLHVPSKVITGSKQST